MSVEVNDCYLEHASISVCWSDFLRQLLTAFRSVIGNSIFRSDWKKPGVRNCSHRSHWTLTIRCIAHHTSVVVTPVLKHNHTSHISGHNTYPEAYFGLQGFSETVPFNLKYQGKIIFFNFLDLSISMGRILMILNNSYNQIYQDRCVVHRSQGFYLMRKWKNSQ